MLVFSMTACSEEQEDREPTKPIMMQFISSEKTDGTVAVTVKWINMTESSFSFGKSGTLYVKNGKSFEKIGDVSGNNMMSILMAGESSSA